MDIKHFSAYSLYANTDDNKDIPIASDFLTHIFNLPFIDTWDINPTVNNSSVTMLQADWVQGQKHKYFFCKFIELRKKDKYDLIDYISGEEEIINIPKEKGEHTSFYFIFCPQLQIALIETKGRGCETKIKKYFSRHWERYKKEKPNLQSLSIELNAIIVEENAKEYVKNKSFSTMQIAIDCEKLKNDETFSHLTRRLFGDDQSQLILNISVSTTRNRIELPKIAVTNFVDLIDKALHDNYIKSAACNEVYDNKKSNKLTKLIDIYLKIGISVSDESEVKQALTIELDNLINEKDDL